MFVLLATWDCDWARLVSREPLSGHHPKHLGRWCHLQLKGNLVVGQLEQEIPGAAQESAGYFGGFFGGGGAAEEATPSSIDPHAEYMAGACMVKAPALEVPDFKRFRREGLKSATWTFDGGEGGFPDCNLGCLRLSTSLASFRSI